MLSNIAGPSLHDLRTYGRVTIKHVKIVSSKIKKKKKLFKKAQEINKKKIVES